jgi:hypothetical protein
MSSTRYDAYTRPESFGQAADRLERERNDLLADAGYLQSEGSQTGRVLADTPGGRTVVYNTNNDDWDQRGRWDGKGGYKKIAKTRCKKCAKSSKKCRYSRAKRSRRRNRNSHSR